MDQVHGAPEVPEVPGLRLHSLLGRGGHGEVWEATDLASGQPVAVKLAVHGRLLEPELALLCRVQHPHVVRMLRVVPVVGGGSAMVLELASGGSLAQLVTRRGRLEPGEVSTLLVPLAAAVEHLHRRGLAHGDLSPGNVLFGADGRPQVGDLGGARLLGTEQGPAWRTQGFTDPVADQADPRAVDVWGLGAVAWFALTGLQPAQADPTVSVRAPALGRLLHECLSLDPQTRPEPTEIARRAWDAAHPLPIDLDLVAPLPEPALRSRPLSQPLSQLVTTPPVEPADLAEVLTTGALSSETSGRRRTGRQRRAVAALGAVVCLIGAATAGLVWSLGGPAPAAPSETAGPRPPSAGVTGPLDTDDLDVADVEAALVRVADARAQAFRTVRVAPLARANEPGSPAAAADRRLVRRLREAGRRLEGLRFSVSQVRLQSGSDPGEAVVVRAVVGTGAHRQVRVADGEAVVVPADQPRSVTITLARVDGAWLVRSVG